MNFRLGVWSPALFAALFLPALVSAASLNLAPSAASVAAGQTIVETVQVSSPNESLNAISGTVSYPTDLLQVISVSKSNSVLTLWVVEPVYSNTDGTVSWSGIVPNPGYIGGRTRVLTITLRAKKAGTANLFFSSDSQVLANDGNGTNILTGTQPSSVTITPAGKESPIAQPSSGTLLPHITSSTHPDQTAWYRATHAIFDWTNAPGVTAVKLGYDTDPSGEPIVVYTDPLSHKELDLSDGVTYFHAQERDGSGWGPIATYRVQIDTVPPHAFDIGFPNGTTTDSGVIKVDFSTSDDLSGIDHYALTLDGKDSTVSADMGAKPYAISAGTGQHTLVVVAFDKAGNTMTAQGKFLVTNESHSVFALGWIVANYLTLALIALAFILLLAFLGWYAHTHFTAYRYGLNRRLGITHARVHKQFDVLKESIADELRNLEQAKSKRTLTRDEQRLITRFRNLLDKTEQAINRDIEEMAE